MNQSTIRAGRIILNISHETRLSCPLHLPVLTSALFDTASDADGRRGYTSTYTVAHLRTSWDVRQPMAFPGAVPAGTGPLLAGPLVGMGSTLKATLPITMVFLKGRLDPPE